MQKLVKNVYFYLIVILIIGAFLRLYQFPSIPPGVNQDEAAAAYEAFSILETGKDKWGNAYPVYLPAWGSGQNALFSYILVPFISIFGLNNFALRLPSVIFGILSILLIFTLVRKTNNKKIALISAFLLAILPWHIMMSRWALESNLLPFVYLLGLNAFIYSLDLKKHKWIIIFSLIPFALGFYAYSLTLFVTPIFLVLVFWFYREKILANKQYWIGAIIAFILFSIPIGLFILKNNILKSSLPFENILPFSVPLFPSSRLDQITEKTFYEIVTGNLWFFSSGFNDFLTWNIAEYYLPLSPYLGVFFVISLVKNIKDLKNGKLNIYLAILLGYIIPFLTVPLNINRFNIGLLAFLIMSTEGILLAVDALAKQSNYSIKGKSILLAIILTLFISYSIAFNSYYFTKYRTVSEDAFNVGLKESIQYAQEKSNGVTKVYLSTSAPINYIYYLYLTESSPAKFQKEAIIEIENGGYNVNKFENFYFVERYFRAQIEPAEVYYVILKESDTNFCGNGVELYKNSKWRVLECFSGANDISNSVNS